MNKTLDKFSTNSLKKDFMASIVVFLVAVPLCLGVAIASGVSPGKGLITGIIGGIVVGYFSGCQLQVSGPAAGLFVIVFEIVNQHGIENLGVIVFAAGLLQLVFGYLKLGQWFKAISPSVIYGMLTGIGILIFISQFHIMIDDLPKANAIENLITIPEAILKGVFPFTGSTHNLAASIGLLNICIISLWNFLPKKMKVVPGVLVAVLVSTIICNYFEFPIRYIDIPHNIMEDIQLLSFNKLSYLLNWEITIAVLAVAFIASAESLLTVTAVTKMRNNIKSNYNKEMTAQGLGNTLAGILGVLPITGVIVRSSANVQAGAETKKSAILHGIWILLFVVLFPFALEKIPTASLAAILVYTGYHLLNFSVVKELIKYGKSEVAIYIITIIAIVNISLLEGILIGFTLSIMKLLYHLNYISIEKTLNLNNKQIDVFIKGNASFINLPQLTGFMEEIIPEIEVHIHINDLDYIDHACIDFLSEWDKSYTANGGKVIIEWDKLSKKINKKINPLVSNI